MSDIVKIQPMHPLLQPNVLQVVKDELFSTVTAAIAKCYADLNMKVPEDPAYLVNGVTDSIQERFPSIRLFEIPIAFANGIRGKYGEYYGLCVISFELFIQGYLDSPERVKLVEQKNLLIEASIEKSADDKFNIQKELCLEIQSKSPALFKLMAAGVYDFLNSLELIDPDYKMGAMKEGLELLIKERATEINLCLDRDKRRKLLDSLNGLRDGITIDQISADHYKACKRVAKRISLINWLRDMVTSETNLEKLIEAKREFYKQSINQNDADTHQKHQ